jgi:peptidoglycan hydrolase-like protein with peptidoglycan-binding domain
MTFDAAAHPRVAAGAAGGGQFAPLSYNASKGTGTGYGKAHGDSRVKAAQTALNKAGFTDAGGKSLVLDGKLGPKTTAAIKAYQRKNGLKADGKITPALLSTLRKGTGKTATHKKASLAPKKTPLRKAAPNPPLPVKVRAAR